MKAVAELLLWIGALVYFSWACWLRWQASDPFWIVPWVGACASLENITNTWKKV